LIYFYQVSSGVVSGAGAGAGADAAPVLGSFIFFAVS
jgi:hypothetical protein